MRFYPIGLFNFFLCLLVPVALAGPTPLRQWTVVGHAGISAGEAAYQSIAVTPDGTPYITYQDKARQGKTTVMKFNGAAWSAVGNVGFSAGSARYQSIAIAPDATPYVAYQDRAHHNKTTVMKYHPPAWVTVGPAGFSASIAQHQQLSISPEGVLYVTYQEIQAGAVQGVRQQIRKMKYNGSFWEMDGAIDVPTRLVKSTVSHFADEISLNTGPDQTLYTIQKDSRHANKATVRMTRDDGGTWETVGEAGFSAGEIYYPCLAIGPDGSLYVAFSDAAAGRKTTVMKY